jgi:hypothetical protein
VRVGLVVAVEVLALLGLLVFVATVVIPVAAPPPARATPALPAGVLFVCPRLAPGCR